MNYDKVPELPDSPAKATHRTGIWWGGAGLLLAAAAVAWWQFGAKPAAPTAGEQQRSAQVAELAEKLDALHTQLAALPEESAPATRRALLEEMLARQTELMRLRVPPAPADAVQLTEWQAQLDDLIARERARMSRELELAAEDLQRHHQPEAAAEKLKEALRLQREINTSMATRGTKSYGREARLQQMLDELTAKLAPAVR